MEENELLERFVGLKEHFRHFYQHRKKIAALENRAYTVKFKHKNHLALIKACLNEGFLEDEEAEFLNYMLKKYETDYLAWAHRTKWLKEQMGIKKKAPKTAPIQLKLNFEKKMEPVYPLALIAMQQQSQFFRQNSLAI